MIEFQNLPNGAVFFDPFVRRTFIKLNEHEAKCIKYPNGWNAPVSPFGANEKVYISK